MTLPQKLVQNVHDMYKDGIPTKEIMTLLGMSKQQVNYILNRVIGVKRRKKVKCPSDDRLYELYVLNKMSQAKIAKRYGVCANTVRGWLDDAELDRAQDKPSKEELHELYRVEKMRRKEIADMYDVSPGVVSRWIDQYGLALSYDAIKKEDCLYIFKEFKAGKTKAELAREYGKTYDWVHRRYQKAVHIQRETTITPSIS
ncbi:hypothetical protein ACWS7L_08170 [Exiguobacterium artemiae]